MKPGLRTGAESIVSFVVDEGMTASFEGRKIHNVLSTFHLVYYAELAARKLIEPFLEEGEEAVGFEISLRHIAPTGIGEKVQLSARLVKLAGKKITCEISASNGSEKICTGSQTQVLVQEGKLY